MSVRTKPHKHKPTYASVRSLLDTEFEPIHWAVESILPEGLSALAGRPKIGKSWLALHLALSVASGTLTLGRYHAALRSVLYLAFEDSKRRLKSRIQKLLPTDAEDTEWIGQMMHYDTTWPTLDQGGLHALDDYLKNGSANTLVVIDTLARFRGNTTSTGSGSAYDTDYAAIAPLQQLAAKYNATILAVTHTRKPRTRTQEDPLDELQGTSGLTGAVDGVLVLKRDRCDTAATLMVTGRDIEEETTLDLLWNPVACTYGVTDGPPLTAEKKAVLDLLQSAGIPLAPAFVAATLGKDPEATKKLLQRMLAQQLITKPSHGLYAAPHSHGD
jgi:hypothetical protein